MFSTPFHGYYDLIYLMNYWKLSELNLSYSYFLSNNDSSYSYISIGFSVVNGWIYFSDSF